MYKVKTGKDFTGYLMFHSKKTGATVRLFVGVHYFHGYAADGVTAIDINSKVPCPTGGSWRLYQGQALYGRFVEELVCGSKCMGATGPSCDCSCGGMNHGGKHGGSE